MWQVHLPLKTNLSWKALSLLSSSSLTVHTAQSLPLDLFMPMGASDGSAALTHSCVSRPRWLRCHAPPTGPVQEATRLPGEQMCPFPTTASSTWKVGHKRLFASGFPTIVPNNIHAARGTAGDSDKTASLLCFP